MGKKVSTMAALRWQGKLLLLVVLAAAITQFSVDAADDVTQGLESAEVVELGASAAKPKHKTFFELDSFKMTSSPVATIGTKVKKPLVKGVVEDLLSLIDETSGKTGTMKMGPGKIPGSRLGFFEGFPSATCSSAAKLANVAKWPLSTRKWTKIGQWGDCCKVLAPAKGSGAGSSVGSLLPIAPPAPGKCPGIASKKGCDPTKCLPTFRFFVKFDPARGFVTLRVWLSNVGVVKPLHVGPMRKKLCPLLLGDKTKWPKCYKTGNLDIFMPKGCFSKCAMLVPMLKKRLIASQLVTKMNPANLCFLKNFKQTIGCAGWVKPKKKKKKAPPVAKGSGSGSAAKPPRTLVELMMNHQ